MLGDNPILGGITSLLCIVAGVVWGIGNLNVLIRRTGYKQTTSFVPGADPERVGAAHRQALNVCLFAEPGIAGRPGVSEPHWATAFGFPTQDHELLAQAPCTSRIGKSNT